MDKQTLGFVIKKNDYKDSDKIVVFLTRDIGKISAIGKFAKKSIKRNLNLLDFGYLLEVSLTYKEQNNIFFIEKIEAKEKIFNENNFLNFLALTYFNEILNSVIYGQEESKDIFELTYKFFKNLSQKRITTFYEFNLNTMIFLLNLLKFLGYNIVTDKCLICGKDGDFLYYSLEKAGFLCNNCKSSENNNLIKVFRGTKKVINNMDKNLKFSENILEQLNSIINAQLRNIITISSYNRIISLKEAIKDGISNIS